ncbi:MAG: MBL fold metallo-hydrolase [Archaeoglobus sp.]|uniref:MBL fold metallo-hydrolase n=1 Tax=Archaeoglobus sp. TaxID=1872626 RepID=UPI001D630036|nr:MBL fold metallo-hydrolase [Archaeoglobus sp.]MBO8179095.1 MBL fold metallo-hydrolase [Archaeoglobus sp.]
MLISEMHGDVEAVKVGTEVQGRVLHWVYLYYYRSLLFDAGCPNTAREVFEHFKGREIKAVLITHYHEDHVGAVNLFKEITDIYVPEESIEILRNPPDIPEYRKIGWGQPERIEGVKVAREVMKFDGVEVRMIKTPGHSFDHVSYLVDDKLFCGDLVINTSQMVCMREEDLLKTIESTEKVLKYDFSYAYTGVGVASRDEVVEYLNYLKGLKEKAEKLYAEGKSIDEIVAACFPKPSQKAILMEFVSEKEWARENMVKSLLGLPRG